MSSHVVRDAANGRKPVTLVTLQEMHRASIPISMLTCYDAAFTEAMDAAGIDCILVGDSLGMVVQGHASTLPVSLQDMVYHTQCVARHCAAAWLISDLPFGSYGESVAQAVHSASELMKAGAKMVKIEGGGWTAPVVRALTERGIPVCAHLGLTPQSVHALGGFRIQGRTDQQAALLIEHARELHEAGAAMLVLELMPTAIAQQVQQAVPGIITIGIGAGNATAGQVLVMHDMLGVTSGRVPKFVRNFLADGGSIQGAFKLYADSVREGSFPDPRVHGY